MKRNLFFLSLSAIMAFATEASSQTYSSTGAVTITPGLDCPGFGAPSSSVINVSGSGNIATPSDVFINTNMTISCFATIKLVLVAPDGDSCILLNMPYRSAACDGSCYNVEPASTLTFNSTYTTKIPEIYPVPAGNYAPTGSVYAPNVGDLATFLTWKPIKGNWMLVGLGDVGNTFVINSWSIVFGSTALPVDLLGFSGLAYTGYNELQWATASEKNTASFDIQRSVDGSDFKTIGNIAAKGFGNNTYSFQDKSYTSVTALYRLRMIDISGEYSYSKTTKVLAKATPGAGAELSANPVKDLIHIKIKDGALLNTEGKIINSLGQTVYTFRIDQENIRRDIAHLPAGVYLLSLKDGNYYRFVKEI